jgi:DNA-binding XRE family transcriptional regulator
MPDKERIMEADVYSLGNRVKEFREKYDGLSQKKLAVELGVSKLTIHLIEHRRVVPSTLLAFKLAKFFNKNVDKVFYLIDNQLLLDGKRKRSKKKKKVKTKKKAKKRKAKKKKVKTKKKAAKGAKKTKRAKKVKKAKKAKKAKKVKKTKKAKRKRKS